jgi:tripartite-type tricarboxylate transporter receptor subunit TctC
MRLIRLCYNDYPTIYNEEENMKLERLLVVVAACLFALPVAAQSWPVRTVRVIVPFAPGGGVDTVTRVLVAGLNKNIGNKFVVDNRAGAAGSVGATLAASAAPDGYTFSASAFEMAINPTMRSKLKFNVTKDFILISVLAHANYILACHPSVPAKTVKQLIALAKARPNVLNYGSSGTGGGNHLTVELFSAMAGIKWVHVPFKGSSPSITAVLAGEIDCTIGSTNSVAPHVKSGRVRALGVTGSKRAPAFPDLARIGEASVPGFVVDGWYGFYAPTGTPSEIIRQVSKETKRAMFSPEARKRLRILGNEPVASSPAEFATFYRAETAKWAKLIKDVGIKPIN